MAEERTRTAAERERERQLREAKRKGVAPPALERPQATERAAVGPPPAAERPLAAKRLPAAERPRAVRGRHPTRRPRGPRARHPRAPASWARRLVAVVPLLAAVVILWFLISLFQPFAGAGTGRVVVTIPARASTGQVGEILARDGVVDSGFFFKLRAKLDGASFRAGTFTLARGMSYAAAIHVLSTASGVGPVTNVTIIPGKSRWQLDRILRSEGVPGSYLADTRLSPLLDPATYGAPPGVHSLEGFLYPDTYQVPSPLRIPALVAEQLTEFKRQFAKVNLSYARSKHLTPYDVLTVASLVEAEAAKPADLPRVASVIYNRLRLHMTLGLDTTLVYVTHNYSGNLTASELALNSPYNTRTHVGLPPTPINSPDLSAINAAAHPARTDDLYFIVRVCGGGSLAFTNSYSQFLQWSAAYAAAEARHGVNGAAFCHRG